MGTEQHIHELQRLLRYARPYRLRLFLGVSALAVLGMAEGLVALMITPMVDRVLNPSSNDRQLPLVKLPGNHLIYLNSFLPHSIHWGWTIFSVALVVIFTVRAIAEYFGVVEIQYVGQAAITDLRNDVYEKLVRQPIEFLQKQPTGRLISAVINDVERARITLSESLALSFRYVFTLFFLLIVMFVVNWQMALASVLLSDGALPRAETGPTDSQIDGIEPVASRRAEPDSSGDAERKSRGEGVWHGALRDRQIPRAGAVTAS